jgi:phage gp29-like protein
MPLRLGRYGPNATQDDIDVLVQAVANIGTDAAAILPEGMRIDFQQTAQGGGAGSGAAVFQTTAEWWDRQVSKGVLGQTASSEGTPGKLGNEDSQEDVRRDILRSDCRQLALTINRDLIRAFVDINFGAQEAYPTFSMPVLEPEDIALIIEALDKLADKGLTVKSSEVRAKLGFSDPQAGDEVIGKKAEEVSAPKPDMEKAANRSQQTTSIDDEIEELGLENWQAQMQPVIDPIKELFDQSENFEDVLQGLRGLEMDMETMIRSLAASTFKARAAGDSDAD